MKCIFFLLIVLGGLFSWTSCANADAHYVDLNSGERVSLEKDASTGLMMNTKSHRPVYLYVNTRTNDTINGRTGMVVNDHVVRTNNGTYRYAGDIETSSEAIANSEGEYKRKAEKNGEVKIKTAHKKIKIEKSGEKKVKD
jgi:hypothetical protein